MLAEMRISNLGVITQASLGLHPGLTVVTGETGAGKTMVVTALGLLLGGRADAGTIRSGARNAVVEGTFVVPADGPTAERAREAGAEMDDADEQGSTELIVSRSVAAGGRGRAHAGGRTVPVATLQELADTLVSLHGQTDQVTLRSPARQRDLLDDAGGPALRAARLAYERTWEELGALRRRLDELTTSAAARAAEASLLRELLGRFERVQPQPGEDHELRALTSRLEHAEDLVRSAAAAHEAIAGPDLAMDAEGLDVLAGLGRARRELDTALTQDPSLAVHVERLTEITVQLTDVAAELASYRSSVEADPARLATAHDRRGELAALVRAVPGGVEDVDAALAWAAQASTRLLELDTDDDAITTLREQVTTLDAELSTRAEELGRLRRETGRRLEEKVSEELTTLAMPHARLLIEIEKTDPGPAGADRISFLLSPHAGAEPRPVGKGASGGELSRVMLALEVALAGSGGIVTFVFDEVDAGVGGKAAVEIGRRLAILARSAQVVVVTHLPQVAAFADRHLVVTKTDDGEITTSGVAAVAEKDRVRELARMLAGLEDSASAKAHARELLAAATDFRASML